MADWSQILLEAINELGGKETYTRGAIVRLKAEEIGRRTGEDLGEFLSTTNQKFGAFVETLEDVEVHRRPGTDMFVGFKGAAWPSADISGRKAVKGVGISFRQDLYDALTKISDRTYYYVRSRDLFTQDRVETEFEDSVALPIVTLDGLLRQRREFADQVTDNGSKEQLLNSVDHSANPLAEFQSTIARLRLGNQWQIHKKEHLKKQLQDWANANQVVVSSTWITEEWRMRSDAPPQKVLADFSQYMTDEEARGLSVPFRAVEAMFRDLTRSRNPGT